MNEALSDDWIEIGRIVAPQGLNGEMRVYPDTDFPERFLEPGDRWLLKPGHTEPETVKLISGRYLAGKGLYVIKLKGVNYRDQVEALREARLLIAASDRLVLEPGEFHVADLVGLTVRLQTTDEDIGTVVDIYSAGNDLLAIELFSDLAAVTAKPDIGQTKKHKSKSAPPVLIPFVEEIVPVVDIDAGYVVINPPPGLLPG
ncbi:ribosome maturation factor RimM [Leptolyngbya iicbica]|uniref:Ribosome maturation factor RimM n=2 Tax=Cyanophyceae TaxID=3028117 RepID=A0A4V2E2J2_9CYAN|nr:ribosome maturation factor RimM [Leptolyngbya sp. LK]RZM78746.1 ribosome maturation factor RimM [Leptolyngbya sp. LK]